MTSVEFVKQLCKDRHIPISRLERDLGFSNGYIAQLRKGSFPTDRAAKVSTYLEIPLDKLMDPDGTHDSSAPSELGPQEELLLDIFRSLNCDGQEEILNHAKYIQSQAKYKKCSDSVSAEA